MMRLIDADAYKALHCKECTILFPLLWIRRP